MLRIALLGYGKMGHNIEAIALEKGHEIVLRISHENIEELTPESIKKSDVAIEFSNPESALKNIMFCLDNQVPIVCGTTGWLKHLPEVENACKEKNGAFLYASNFSVGVNIFFQLNQYLAQLMERHPEYNVSLEEIHHTQKLDAPSGTAITLAEQIIDILPGKNKWVNEETSNDSELSIISKRTDEVPGTHIIQYGSAIDCISISHIAHSRKGFAAGAVMAAEFLYNKKGIYSMKDVLNF